jgi:hypothetical protein
LTGFSTLLKMPARLMEDAGAMSRAMRWGDGACIDDMVERGRMNPPQPDRLEAGCLLPPYACVSPNRNVRGRP